MSSTATTCFTPEAMLFERLGRHGEAAVAFGRAMSLTTNAAEVELVRTRPRHARP